MSESSAARPTQQAAVLPPELRVKQERVGCYTGLYEADASVVRPKNVEELREVFRFARESPREVQVTIRGGGHSFDAQPIGNDLVVSTERLNSIELLDGDRVRVGPGATWGEIFAATQRHGLVPAGTVTTENATAGRDALGRLPLALLDGLRQGGQDGRELRVAHSPRRASPLLAAARGVELG